MKLEQKLIRMKLERHLNKFINSGLKYTTFTNDLYDMLYIDSNKFIAHYDKAGFYNVRFLKEADKTVEMLKQVTKPELRDLCQLLASAIQLQMKPEVFTKLYMSVHSKGGA